MFFLVTVLFACSLLIDDAVQLGTHETPFNQFALARNRVKRLDELDCKTYCRCPEGPVLHGIDEDEESSGSALSLGKPGTKRTEKTASTLDAIYYNYPSPVIRRIFV